ncbi:cytochrome P450 [Aestuariirhabdus sp. Z084]|uniref:cytochrome P450 n=1 Tax=Aestuariirhabdus haliotis TaxID=2918751 RepID=UPI0020BFF011|nr:cytochrome P450 [Aestuariirhabdus haliotis]MCL6417674.1 cytochrome P450 [Aestuariirhabdus haliotis]
MSQSPASPHPYETPIEQINVSDPRLYEQDAWRPYFERLRQQDPVHYQAESAFGPFWSITRFEDIVAVDTNHEVFSSEPTIVIGDLLEETPFEMFIAMDPPKHDVQRRAAQPVVAPKNLAEMEGLIRSRVIDILDTLPVGETFDWVDRVSINLTTQMLATLFDFPFEQRHKLTYWSDIAAGSPEIAGGDVSQEERQAGLQDCLETFTRLWHEKKAQNEQQNNSRFDLISLLQKDPNTADMVDRPMELMGNLILLIVGGNDTTRNSATGGVLALNQNPAEYDKLRANHALIPGMVSEIIRWQTPLAHMRRTATRDIEFQGKQIRQGDKVVMWYLSGNRDESAIDNADQFIIDRANPRHHLSFGFGIHRCMGNRLAEMQLRILWEEIMQRFRFVEVMGEPERVKSNLVRGYKTLPVRLHPL